MNFLLAPLILNKDKNIIKKPLGNANIALINALL